MAYVVIACSRCRLARGAPETAKTASCPRCGRKLPVPELRKYYRSESLDRIREAIGQLNARLKGGLDAYIEDLDKSAPGTKPGKAPAPASPGEADEDRARRDDVRLKQSGRAVPSNKVDRAIIMCLIGKGALSAGELLPLLSVKCQPGQLERRLEALLRTGLVYEPRSGRYALVG